MSGRTPSFIVVGLVIIMFLLGFFYMSCSSKNSELRLSAELFEDQIRSLTLKNRDAEKKIDSLITRKRELDEEKLTIQRQMEKKDSEINDLNTKLNERIAELQSLKTDKKVLEEQMKELKTLSETIGAKNSLIEKLQQQINDEKQFGVNEQLRLKDEISGLKNRLSQNVVPSASTNGTAEPLLVPNERFAPKFFNNLTTRSIASLFRNSREESTNNSREIRPKIVQAGVDLTQNVLNVLAENKSQLNPPVGQNVPPPPLSQNDSQIGQPNPVESAQAAPRFARGSAIDSNQQQNASLNKPIVDDLDDDEIEEDQQVDEPREKNPVEVPAAKEPLAAENENRFGRVDRQRDRPREAEDERLDHRQRSGRQRKSLRRNRLGNNEENQREDERRAQHVL